MFGCCMSLFIFFFFKQKTAYEMRISDWSSDVCSSDLAGGFSQRIRAIETCGKPVAAVIAGLALGGGLELALGCHFRVAVDDPKLRLALPEASIGLMPGAGGTQRLSRLIGVNAAMPYLLDGKVISPARSEEPTSEL